MPLWVVNGTEELDRWYGDLVADNQGAVDFSVGVLEEGGPSLGRPHVDTVDESKFPNMKELRAQSGGKPLRIFFAFDPNREAILLIGGDKRATYDSASQRPLSAPHSIWSKKLPNKPWREIRETRSKLRPEQRAEIDRAVRSETERMKLGELRKVRRLSQAQIAASLGLSQGDVSKIERRAELYVSTLRRFIEAAGGELEIIATFPAAAPIVLEFLTDDISIHERINLKRKPTVNVKKAGRNHARKPAKSATAA